MLCPLRMLQEDAVSRAVFSRIGDEPGFAFTECLLKPGHQRLAVRPLNEQVLKSVDHRKPAAKIQRHAVGRDWSIWRCHSRRHRLAHSAIGLTRYHRVGATALPGRET